MDLSETITRIITSLSANRPVCLCEGGRYALLAGIGPAVRYADAATMSRGARGMLLLRSASSARDFTSTSPPVARRLMRHCWPGAVLLTFAEGVDSRLIASLPQGASAALQNPDGLTLNVPKSDVLMGVLQRIAYPLIRWNLGTRGPGEVDGLTVVSWDSQSSDQESEIRLDHSGWSLVPGSALTEAEVARMAVERVLFVCTGNTCRSPMAAAMFRHLLAERLGCSEDALGAQGYEVASAGLSALPGSPASPESVEIFNTLGIDLHDHVSQPLTEELLFESSRIYTMTSAHRDSILARYPELEDEVRLLSPQGEDVSDPMGWGPDAYEQCHQEIASHLKVIVDELAAADGN